MGSLGPKQGSCQPVLLVLWVGLDRLFEVLHEKQIAIKLTMSPQAWAIMPGLRLLRQCASDFAGRKSIVILRNSGRGEGDCESSHTDFRLKLR